MAKLKVGDYLTASGPQHAKHVADLIYLRSQGRQGLLGTFGIMVGMYMNNLPITSEMADNVVDLFQLLEPDVVSYLLDTLPAGPTAALLVERLMGTQVAHSLREFYDEDNKTNGRKMEVRREPRSKLSSRSAPCHLLASAR